MSPRRQNSSMEAGGLIRLFETVFIASIIIMVFLLFLLPFNYKDKATLVVSVMALFFSILNAFGSGLAMIVMARKKRSKQ